MKRFALWNRKSAGWASVAALGLAFLFVKKKLADQSLQLPFAVCLPGKYQACGGQLQVTERIQGDMRFVSIAILRPDMRTGSGFWDSLWRRDRGVRPIISVNFNINAPWFCYANEENVFYYGGIDGGWVGRAESLPNNGLFGHLNPNGAEKIRSAALALLGE